MSRFRGVPRYVKDPKKPRLKRDWVGRKVRTVVMMRNGNMEIPIGTVCEVTYNRGGLTLKTEPCDCCGVAIYITRVPERDVRLLMEVDA